MATNMRRAIWVIALLVLCAARTGAQQCSTIGVNCTVKVIAQANVWQSVDPNNGVSGFLGTEPVGAQGTVIAGPITSSGGTFWQTRFTDLTGWVGADFLQPTGSGPTPPPVISCSPNCPAFPALPNVPNSQAAGGGAATTGGSGRGGTGTPRVIEVTSLASSGPGTLRACVQASGPRTCVFRVSGQIVELGDMSITNPFLTVAGQTAPGSGIVIGGAGAQGRQFLVSTHDVIIRYITFDGFDPNLTINQQTGPSIGSIGLVLESGEEFNVMVDHTSHRWIGNKGMQTLSNGTAGAGNVRNITFQWSLWYEPIWDGTNGHPVISSLDTTTGSALASVNQDVHHNMGIEYDHRWMLYNIRSSRQINNIDYDGQQLSASFRNSSWGALQGDYVGNKQVFGPESANPNHMFNANPTQCGSDPSNSCPGDNDAPPSIYMLNNLGCAGASTRGCTPITPSQTPNDAGQQSLAWQGGEGGDGFGTPNAPWPGSWFRATPLPTQAFPIPVDDVTTLDSKLPPTVGNSAHLDCLGNFVNNRDSNDTRIITQYNNRGPGHMQDGTYREGAFVTGTPCTESQHDGIPDQWKAKFGLSTTDPNLFSKIGPDGYTYLEEYLNGFSGAPLVQPPAAPTNLAAAVSGTSVTLTWTASTSAAATGTNVYRGTINGGPYTPIASGLTATTFTDTPTPAGTYFYVVTAFTGGIVSSITGTAGTATVTCTATCAFPTGFSAVVQNNSIAGFNGTFPVAGQPTASTFTFASTATGTGTGGGAWQTGAESGKSNQAQASTAVTLTSTLVPSSLTFASQLVGTTSLAQQATFINTSPAGNSLTISSIALGGTNPGDYATTTTCGASLASGSSCTVNVTFTPLAAGTRTATLTVTSSSSNSPQTTSLTGTGTAAAAGAVLTPGALIFGAQLTGSSSSPAAVTLKNTGTGTLNISSISIVGSNFSQTNGCGATLAPNATCTINVTFSPVATGTVSATLQMADNAAGSPQTVGLTGTGVTTKVQITPGVTITGQVVVGGP